MGLSSSPHLEGARAPGTVENTNSPFCPVGARAGRVGPARGSWGREPGRAGAGVAGARAGEPPIQLEQPRAKGRANRPPELGMGSGGPLCISGKANEYSEVEKTSCSTLSIVRSHLCRMTHSIKLCTQYVCKCVEKWLTKLWGQD